MSKSRKKSVPAPIPATGDAYGGGFSLGYWSPGSYGTLAPPLSQDQFGSGYSDVAVGSDGSTGSY